MNRQKQSLEIIDKINRKVIDRTHAHVEFYLASLLCKIKYISKNMGAVKFDSFVKRPNLYNAIGMIIINIGQIAFEMEIVFPKENFWHEEIDKRGRRIVSDMPVPFGKIPSGFVNKDREKSKLFL